MFVNEYLLSIVPNDIATVWSGEETLDEYSLIMAVIFGVALNLTVAVGLLADIFGQCGDKSMVISLATQTIVSIIIVVILQSLLFLTSFELSSFGSYI